MLSEGGSGGKRRMGRGKCGRGKRNETKENVKNSPNPKVNGAKKIILTFDAPERWYADNIHALKTISSVIGAWVFCVYVSVCGKEWRGGE